MNNIKLNDNVTKLSLIRKMRHVKTIHNILFRVHSTCIQINFLTIENGPRIKWHKKTNINGCDVTLFQ